MSLFDEIRKRTARYILQSETILVRSVAGFGVFTGRCNSFIGKLESCIDDQRQFEMAVYLYNCSNFSTSDRMHEINFGNLKFFVGLGFPHWVLVLISAYHWFPVKLPITYAHDTGKNGILAPVPPTLEAYRIFHNRRVRYLTFMGLPLDCRDPL